MIFRPLSKDITQMDLNKLSSGEDIWTLKFNIEKCKVQYIGSKNIKIKSNKWEIKIVNVERDLGVGFDDTFKTDNPILSVVSRINGMIYFKRCVGVCCFGGYFFVPQFMLAHN